MTWTPAPGEKVWVEATASPSSAYGFPLSDGKVLPHAVLDALKEVVGMSCMVIVKRNNADQLEAMGSSGLLFALRVLEQCGEVRCVVEGDDVTARFEWVTK